MVDIVPIPVTARFQVLSGKRFGRWTVIGWSGRRHRSYITWVCRCDCGRIGLVYSTNLKKGHSQSCGCIQRLSGDHSNISHSPEYTVWQSMMARCHRPHTTKSFPDYGGRGIYVCDRWRFGENGVGGFLCFLPDMGNRPSLRHQIDRIDNDGPYTPENCRWLTRDENMLNRRNTRLVVFRDETMPLVKACELSRMPYQPVLQRLMRGWTLERALNEPL